MIRQWPLAGDMLNRDPSARLLLARKPASGSVGDDTCGLNVSYRVLFTLALRSALSSLVGMVLYNQIHHMYTPHVNTPHDHMSRSLSHGKYSVAAFIHTYTCVCIHHVCNQPAATSL